MTRVLTAAAAICFALSVAVHGQTSTAAPQQNQSNQSQEISPEKRALVKELVDVLNVKKSAKDMLEVIEAQMQKQMVDTMWQTLSQMKEMKELTDEERQDLQDKIKENAQQGFKRFVDSLNKRVDFGQLTEDVSISVYAKYFTEKELKDLIVFYNSDTGKRSMEIAPSLMAESMSLTCERLEPVMNDIVRDIASDDTNKLRNEVTALAKSHHRQATTRPRATRRRG
jgi:hypothetical protein